MNPDVKSLPDNYSLSDLNLNKFVGEVAVSQSQDLRKFIEEIAVSQSQVPVQILNANELPAIPNKNMNFSFNNCSVVINNS